MGIYRLIKFCSDLEELNFFVLSEVWKGSQDIRNAILIRYDQLDPGREHKDQFGTPEFWEHDPLEEYEMSEQWHSEQMDTDDYEEANEWLEGKHVFKLNRNYWNEKCCNRMYQWL